MKKIDVQKALLEDEKSENDAALEKVECLLNNDGVGYDRRKSLERERQRLENYRDTLAGDGRYKEYRRKTSALVEKAPFANGFMSGDKNAAVVEFSNDQGCIYYSVLRLASTKQSIVARWCNKGLDDFTSEEITELYECIRTAIYTKAGIDGFGKKNAIDEYLQVLDVEISYSVSKRIVGAKCELEKMRKEGVALDHQINVGSIICSDEDGTYYARAPYGANDSAVPKNVNPMGFEGFFTLEQYLSGLEGIIGSYETDIKKKSKKMVDGCIEAAKSYEDFHSDDQEEDEEGNDALLSSDDFIEYKQRNANVIKFIQQFEAEVKDILDKHGIDADKAIQMIKAIK